MPPIVQQSVRTFEQAVQLLQKGHILIYPTETFFAVGCSMQDTKALEHIFTAKNRAQSKPLPVLAADMEQVQRIAHMTDDERTLGRIFWPGSLTLLCQAKPCVPLSVTAHTGRVAVRISPHSTARALAAAMNAPLVCSSANISGEAPPRLPQEISPQLLPKVQGLVLDGEEPQGGLPSTIVEVCAPKTIRIRRHGAIQKDILVATLHAHGERHWEILLAET